MEIITERGLRSTDGWLDPGCEFSCCHCCPKSVCRCGLNRGACNRPLWNSRAPYLEKEAHHAIVNYIILSLGLVGILITTWALCRDIPQLPRRTRMVNPVGHSEGSLCLLHSWQPQPDGVGLLSKSSRRLRMTAAPVSLVQLLPARGETAWLQKMASAQPPAPLPSPLLPSLEKEPLRDPPANAPPLAFLPSQLYLVGSQNPDRCAVLILSPDELDNFWA